jgi:hypothetical protein
MAEVRSNKSLSVKEKKKQKKIFLKNQQTKESLINPYSNLIPPLNTPPSKINYSKKKS